MNLLLDSNALLWLVAGDPALGPRTRARIEQASRLYVSDVSLFEISVKAARGKLDVPLGFGTLLDQLGVTRVGIRDAHLDAMRALPFHHADPFDRYVIAQSLVDSLAVVTSDQTFARYDVQVIDARD